MTAPPWGHKPPKVDDIYQYTFPTVPPEPSPRMVYWGTRLRAGTWTPNRWILGEGWDGRAAILGIYGWESVNVLHVITQWPKRVADRDAAAWQVHRGAARPVEYWQKFELATRPDGRFTYDTVQNVCWHMRNRQASGLSSQLRDENARAREAQNIRRWYDQMNTLLENM